MKSFFKIVVTLFVLASCASSALYGQAKINTKKLKIADLPTRTTKVVLGSGDMMDSALRDEVAARWRISPYEFCTAEEYKALKEDSNYYFLVTARSDEQEYHGIRTLTLIKGDKPKAEDPQKRSVEVASLPISAAGFPSGREVVFLPAMLDILQDYVTKAMRSDGAGYKGFDIYAGQVRKTGIKRIYFSEDDLVDAPAAEHIQPFALIVFRLLNHRLHAVVAEYQIVALVLLLRPHACSDWYQCCQHAQQRQHSKDAISFETLFHAIHSCRENAQAARSVRAL